MTDSQKYPEPSIETNVLLIKDENGHLATPNDLAKRYREELEQRSRYWKTRWWDQQELEKKYKSKRKHRPL